MNNPISAEDIKTFSVLYNIIKLSSPKNGYGSLNLSLDFNRDKIVGIRNIEKELIKMSRNKDENYIASTAILAELQEATKNMNITALDFHLEVREGHFVELEIKKERKRVFELPKEKDSL